MATNRLDMLRQMVQQDPKNTFARYGLAMELANSGSTEAAVTEYQALLDIDRTYAAAYFHAAQALEKLGRIDDARTMYEQGIEVTTAKGDAHTRAELEAALSLLPV